MMTRLILECKVQSLEYAFTSIVVELIKYSAINYMRMILLVLNDILELLMEE